MTITLFMDPGNNNKVLFAECEKDFVDFMFSFLLLPLGSVVKIVNPGKILGCIEKVYESVENMKETYLIENIDKSLLLDPEFSPLTDAFSLLHSPTVGAPQPEKNHGCSYCRHTVTCTSGAKKEEGFMKGKGEGFVKGMSTYIITDSLKVMPKTAVSILFLIKSFGVKNSHLKEKVVVIGKEQV
ncbi:hypothetical protein KSP39_PZI003787 [Platanthera zijinensis]|uniref:Uncharacterized protein n=1 Tax=Platanthera zijinensis TaxID=2320716 RepID=A0AAP0GCB5_9ASPA